MNERVNYYLWLTRICIENASISPLRASCTLGIIDLAASAAAADGSGSATHVQTFYGEINGAMLSASRGGKLTSNPPFACGLWVYISDSVCVVADVMHGNLSWVSTRNLPLRMIYLF